MTDHRPQRSPGILAMWSAPRSRSTAFARMMAERGDYTVLHEPFSHVIDFGESTVGERLARTEEELIDAIWEFAASRPVFFKDTTDFHYPRMLADQAFLIGPTHTFIIRHPAQAIASHYALNPQLGRDEVGFAWLAEIYDAVAAATGTAPVVIEADDLVERPQETVRAYCEAVRIPFLPEALCWRPGMADQWRRTSRWHESTSRTSGFASTPGPSPSGSPGPSPSGSPGSSSGGSPGPSPSGSPGSSSGGSPGAGPDVESDPVLSGYLAYHLPYYERLRAVAVKP